MTHPARYSAEVLNVIFDWLEQRYPDWLGRPHVHDPWAGTGERLRVWANDRQFPYSGTEIEKSFIEAPGILHGDSTDPTTYPDRRPDWALHAYQYVIATSITYPNGMADHHRANDDSVRKTYRKAISEIEGEDRELAETNMARYGYRGTKRGGTSKKREAFWDLADRTVTLWSTAEFVIVNAKDFQHSNDQIEPFVSDVKQLLAKHGWLRQTDIPVGTPGMRYGENHAARVDCEYVIVAER